LIVESRELREKLRESLLRSVSRWDNLTNVSSETEEIIRICEALPENKRTEVTDFARFLLAQQDDARWEELLDDERPRPKLEKFVREALAEGSEALDLERL
jgi:hypothetical protein